MKNKYVYKLVVDVHLFIHYLGPYAVVSFINRLNVKFGLFDRETVWVTAALMIVLGALWEYIHDEKKLTRSLVKKAPLYFRPDANGGNLWDFIAVVAGALIGCI